MPIKTEVASYCSRAFSLDPDLVFDAFDAAMSNLQGEPLQLALKHLYFQWGNGDDPDVCALFVSVMTKLAIGSRLPKNPARPTSITMVNESETSGQGVLF